MVVCDGDLEILPMLIFDGNVKINKGNFIVCTYGVTCWVFEPSPTVYRICVYIGEAEAGAGATWTHSLLICIDYREYRRRNIELLKKYQIR